MIIFIVICTVCEVVFKKIKWLNIYRSVCLRYFLYLTSFKNRDNRCVIMCTIMSIIMCIIMPLCVSLWVSPANHCITIEFVFTIPVINYLKQKCFSLFYFFFAKYSVLYKSTLVEHISVPDNHS